MRSVFWLFSHVFSMLLSASYISCQLNWSMTICYCSWLLTSVAPQLIRYSSKHMCRHRQTERLLSEYLFLLLWCNALIKQLSRRAYFSSWPILAGNLKQREITYPTIRKETARNRSVRHSFLFLCNQACKPRERCHWILGWVSPFNEPN